MKECRKCKIKIETKHEYCPLCHQKLVGETSEKFMEVYPIKEQHHIIIPVYTQKIIIFISILLIIIVGVVNLFTKQYGFWSIIPIGVIFYSWLLMKYTVLSKRKMHRRINGTNIIIILLVVFINLVTSRDNLWSIDYVLPSLIMANNFIIMLLMIIKNKEFKHYAKTLLLLALFSSIPLILFTVGLTQVYTMAVLTFSHGILIILFMLIFYPKVLRDVLSKLFHI